jgi:hypothetical protein
MPARIVCKQARSATDRYVKLRKGEVTLVPECKATVWKEGRSQWWPGVRGPRKTKIETALEALQAKYGNGAGFEIEEFIVIETIKPLPDTPKQKAALAALLSEA